MIRHDEVIRVISQDNDRPTSRREKKRPDRDANARKSTNHD
jgi:hypothetical protein